MCEGMCEMPQVAFQNSEGDAGSGRRPLLHHLYVSTAFSVWTTQLPAFAPAAPLPSWSSHSSPTPQFTYFFEDPM